MALPDISLREFNTIATGKYNAGLIDFTTDEQGVTKLTKLNNHIKKIKLNGVKMTPERILEVKETFIKALQGGGLKNEDVSAIRAKLGIPTDILLGEFDVLSEGLDEKEEVKLKGDVYFVATGELGLGYWDALKEPKILEALMKDAQKMGGDKDYKVDIGV